MARTGEDACALGGSKQADAQPPRSTTSELDAPGIDAVRFGVNV